MMRFRQIHVCLIAVLAASCLAGTESSTGTQAAGKNPFVRVDGERILSPDGQPLRLRGINLGNWLVPEGYMFDLKRVASPKQIDEVVSECLGDVAAARF